MIGTKVHLPYLFNDENKDDGFMKSVHYFDGYRWETVITRRTRFKNEQIYVANENLAE